MDKRVYADRAEYLREYRRKYYAEHRVEILEQQREYYFRDRVKQLEQIRGVVNGHKVKCSICGTCEGILDFHHRDPTTKKFNVGDLNRIIEKILAEIDKCDVVCRSCHNKLRKKKESE